MRGFLNTDWHGVPEGTELMVTREFRDIQGDKLFTCLRKDGEDLPQPGGATAPLADIAAAYVNLDA